MDSRTFGKTKARAHGVQTGMRCALRLFLCSSLAWAANSPAQTEPVSPFAMMGVATACGDNVCPPPSDPRRRATFVLRLQAIKRAPAFTMPTGPSERGSIGQVAGMQRQATEAASRNSASLLARGAGEAYAGRHAAAQQLLDRALGIAVSERDATAEAASLANLGVVAAMQGRYGEARERMNSALGVFRKAIKEPSAPSLPAAPVAPGPPGVAAQSAALAAAQQSAVPEMQRLMEVEQAKRGAFLVLLNQGSLAAHIGQYAEAVQLLIDPALNL